MCYFFDFIGQQREDGNENHIINTKVMAFSLSIQVFLPLFCIVDIVLNGVTNSMYVYTRLLPGMFAISHLFFRY